MKKIIFLIFILFSSSLFASDLLNDFIDEQIKTEAALADQNLSLEHKIDIKKAQAKEYKDFLLRYTAQKEEHLREKNPYRYEISKLKFRINKNKYLGYTNAVLRDEVLLKNYAIRKGIRNAFHDVLQHADSESKAFFKDKIDETLVKYFSKYKPLDKKEYLSPDQDQSNPIVKDLLEAVKERSYLESVANTFSAEVVENSSNIYQASRFSKSKLFTAVKTINESYYGQKINSYLSSFPLDIGKFILLLAIIILILITQSVIRFMINRILKHYQLTEEDIEYIHPHITKTFTMITSLLIIHLILVAYLGFDSIGIDISKLFSVLYVILAALLLYRTINSIAYIKIESIKSSKILKDEVINLSLKIINGMILIVAIIAILNIAGVDLTALLSGLGIAGAAVAFAAKDSISNIFGSLSIMMGDVFEQGDWIETDDVDGTVVEIGLRASTIRSFDNALISIPNSKLANSGVKNWSKRNIGRRIKMDIALTYQSDFDDIRQAITDIRLMLKEHPGVANERTSYQSPYRRARLVSLEDYRGVKRTTLVYMDQFAPSSINILVYCFSRSVVWSEWLEVKEDVMFKIAEIIKKNNLDFAYPTLTVHQAEEEAKEIKNQTK